ncbi:MAG TPA: FAD-binding and (Fe-S)-binding domain-containing protein [Symbiobacteriaceae bacterium]|jgi:Fe-S oxidoreductase/FAD/FMN-containing dehydrogenase
MPALTPEIKAALTALFGDRARFNKVERIVYSHDMGALPDSIRKAIAPVPDAVVQPVSDEEVVALLKLAEAHALPLVPRGAASSAYGGAVPAASGVVVDFTRMNRILRVDRDHQTVTVEPGVVWQDLQNSLAQSGLAPRLYPTSAPSSTVAGWVAQGGSGVGSYEYGFIGRNVLSVKVAVPGSVTEVSGEDLKLVDAMEGITGLILEVTLAVRKLSQDVPVLAAFPNRETLFGALEDLREKQTGLWSVSVATPTMVAMKQKASNHHDLPEDRYLALMVFPAGREALVMPSLKAAVIARNGELLSPAQAEKEWDERFYPMRLKKLGPSVISSEVIVPLHRAADFLKEAEDRFSGEIAFEGTMVGSGEVTLLGFILADERRKSFSLAYSSALVVMDSVRKYGGRLYSLGMYFTDDAPALLGPQLLARLVQHKEAVDPKRVLNPGKILPPSVDRVSPLSMLNAAVKVARVGKSVLSMASNLLARFESGEHESDLPDGVAEDSFACAQCGYCRSVCTAFDAVPWETSSPRGKWYLLKEYQKGNIPFDAEVADALYACTTCKRCETVCQLQMPIAEEWMHMRSVVGEKGFELSGLDLIRHNVVEKGNFWGLPNETRKNCIPSTVKTLDNGPVGYWPGCWASFVMSNMPTNISRILQKAGQEFVYLGEQETCCGLYHALGGYTRELGETVKKNIDLFHERGIKTLLLACPGCHATFTETYPEVARHLGLNWDIKVKHVTVLLDEMIREGRLPFEKSLDGLYTYHDSCHLGRWAGIYEQPRDVIKAIPGVTYQDMAHNREDGFCCGLVAAFNSLPTVAHTGAKRVAEAEEIKADVMITACAGCGSQLNATSRAMGARVRQRDITDVVAEALGLEVQDPSETVGAFMGKAVELLKDSKVRATAR